MSTKNHGRRPTTDTGRPPTKAAKSGAGRTGEKREAAGESGASTRRPLLRCRELAKDYGGMHALGPVSLDIADGQAVALVGHNGSGKSTLLSLVAGLLEPSSGTVEVAGVPAGEQAARAAVAYIPDTPVLYDDLSVDEHLAYLTRLHGSSPEEHDVDGRLEAFGLTARRGDLPSDFSRGLRQKTAITVAVSRPFRLLCIDEPFSGLDRRGRDALLELIGVERDRGRTVMVATHDAAALDVFDRVIELEQGEIVDDRTG